MPDPSFLRVRNWAKFQYRTDKTLPWIRTYNEQLEDYEYTSLTDAQRGHLHDIRLLANRTRNKIPNDAGWVRAAIRSSRAPDLDMLTRRGFLEPWSPQAAQDELSSDAEQQSSARPEHAPSANHAEKGARSGSETPANGVVPDAQSALGVRPECAGDREVDVDEREKRFAVKALQMNGTPNNSHISNLISASLADAIQNERTH